MEEIFSKLYEMTAFQQYYCRTAVPHHVCHRIRSAVLGYQEAV